MASFNKKKLTNFFVRDMQPDEDTDGQPRADSAKPDVGAAPEYVISSAQPRAIPYDTAHTKPAALAQIDSKLDTKTETAKAEKGGAASLVAMHAFYNGSAGEQSASSYNYPHHDNNGKVYLSAVKSAQTQLNTDAATSRKLAGGASVNETNARIIDSHLNKHLAQFGIEPSL